MNSCYFKENHVQEQFRTTSVGESNACLNIISYFPEKCKGNFVYEVKDV